jgi:hypothetical protein
VNQKIVREKDGQLKIKYGVDRSVYMADYYQKTKEKRKENYNAQTQYLRWIEVKKTMNRLKKQIGTVNFDLIMGEIGKLEKYKHEKF